MNEQQNEAELLVRVIGFDDTVECRRLEEEIAKVQRDERCVQRAASFVAVFAALIAAFLGYEAVFEQNFLFGQYPFVIKLMYELGLASLISLVAFAGLWMLYRMRLNRLRKECGLLVTKLPESPVLK
jgi:hypothetical protein